MSLTALKAICREHGVERWPYRRLRCINVQIARLEVVLQGDTERLGENSHSSRSRSRHHLTDSASAGDDDARREISEHMAFLV